MNYNQITETEARDVVENDFGIDAVKAATVTHAPTECWADVLYYADAYGDLTMAFVLQGFAKDLPSDVHKGLYREYREAGWDVLEISNKYEPRRNYCAACETELFWFEWTERGHVVHTEAMDEYGNVSEYLEYVGEFDGMWTNPTAREDNAYWMCAACSHDHGYHTPDFSGSQSGNVRVHFGDLDQLSGFSIWQGLIRWDFEWEQMDDRRNVWTDLLELPGGEQELPTAFATETVSKWLEANDWRELSKDAVKDACSARIQIKGRTFDRAYRTIAEGWAESKTETHPDLDFTYVIEFASWGSPSFLVAEEHYDDLLAEVVDLIERKI